MKQHKNKFCVNCKYGDQYAIGPGTTIATMLLSKRVLGLLSLSLAANNIEATLFANDSNIQDNINFLTIHHLPSIHPHLATMHPYFRIQIGSWLRGNLADSGEGKTRY